MSEQEFYEQGMRLGYAIEDLRKIVKIKNLNQDSKVDDNNFEDTILSKIYQTKHTRRNGEEG